MPSFKVNYFCNWFWGLLLFSELIIVHHWNTFEALFVRSNQYNCI